MWTVEVCALWGGCEEGVLENRLDEGSVLKVKVKDKGKSGGHNPGGGTPAIVRKSREASMGGGMVGEVSKDSTGHRS